MITVEDWLLQFARLFKNIINTLASNDAQELFGIATDKFQEMLP